MDKTTVHTNIIDELKQGKTVTYFTVGVSMRPLLMERKTHVFIAPLDCAKNGDILLYVRENGSLVLHRCIRQDADCYFMRGDNTYGLEKIRKEQAIGVVMHIYRKGKTFATDCVAYRVYVCLWRLLYPTRFVLKFMKEIIRKLIKGVTNI